MKAPRAKLFFVAAYAAALIFMLGLSSISSAILVTFHFDPNDWVTNYSTDISKSALEQDNPRQYTDGVALSTDVLPGTHTTYAGGTTGIQGYANQITGIEIYDFNMWLIDGGNAPQWGEVLTQVVGGTDPSGTATNGWIAQTVDYYGYKIVQWYDLGYWDGDSTTPANPLTFGSDAEDIDFGEFTLTVDINPTDVYGNPVNPHDPQRIWLGTWLPDEWTPDPNNLVYTDHKFEGVMEMINPVPEPSTLLLLGSGLLGLAGYGRMRFRRRKE